MSLVKMRAGQVKSQTKQAPAGSGRTWVRATKDLPEPEQQELPSEGEAVFGVVTNLTDWGAFIDIGYKKHGLLPKNQVRAGLEIGDSLDGLVVSRVDTTRKRISLALAEASKSKANPGQYQPTQSGLEAGSEVTGKVASITNHGIFVDIGAARNGLLPWRLCTLKKEDVRFGQVLESLRIESIGDDKITLSGPSGALDWSSYNSNISAKASSNDGSDWWSKHTWNSGDDKNSWWTNDGSWWQESNDEDKANWQSEEQQQQVHEAKETSFASVKPRAQASPEPHPPKPAPPATRADLKLAVFRLYDRDQDGHLNSIESMSFAKQTGFDGTEENWNEEYLLLCSEMSLDARLGLDWNSFSKMVDDDSDGGCFATDDELRDILKIATVKAAPNQSVFPTGGDLSRQNQTEANSDDQRHILKRDVFAFLDTNKDCYLDKNELWPFVLKTGFDGTPSDWSEEYCFLCSDLGAKPTQGIDTSQFFTLLDDVSDKGCYCTDNELRAILETAKQNSRAQSTPSKPADACKVQQATTFELQEPPGLAGKGKIGKGKGKLGKGKNDKEAVDGLMPTADPLSALQDPWSTPAAVVSREKMKANSEKQGETWDKWRDTGKPGIGPDPSKPVMDVQRLLEASRAALAARRSKEVPEVKEMTEDQDHSSKEDNIQSGDQDQTFQDQGLMSTTGDDEDGFWGTKDLQPITQAPKPLVIEPAPSQSYPSKMPSAPIRNVKRATSMADSMLCLASAVARLAMGDQDACSDLVDAVLGAPCLPHAAALVSSAFRSLFLGRPEEAQTLLTLDELLLLPLDGDTALLLALAELTKAVPVCGIPLLLRTFVVVMSKVEDRHTQISSAAIAVTGNMITRCDPLAFEALFPAFAAGLDAKRSPAVKVHTLRLLKMCWKRDKDGEAAVVQKLPDLLRLTTALVLDTNTEVRAVAKEATSVLMSLCGNLDLAPFLDEILGCNSGTRDVSKGISRLAEIIFVQTVDAPAFAVMLPVLTKGLKSRNARTLRQACMIAENMGRLVSAVADLSPFSPHLLPLLQRIGEDADDPDVRAVAKRAHNSIAKVATADATGNVRKALRSLLDKAMSYSRVDDVVAACPAHVRDVILDHAVQICLGLGMHHAEEQQIWHRRVMPLLEPLTGSACLESLLEEMRHTASILMISASSDITGASNADPDQVLCDRRLTLACGAATLLNQAHLQLCKGRVYGVVGANDSGKSTMLRALHERRVSGFPPAAELSTALVEHGIGEEAPSCDLLPVQFLYSDEVIRKRGLSQNQILAKLKSIGFDEGARLRKPIKTLSGGWRMKLGLARAMLQAADVLLLDEPTGHLDSSHITWLVDYIKEAQAKPDRLFTVLVVSHDAPFLDRICTDIIHVDGAKLKYHSGTFAEFRLSNPIAQLGMHTGTSEDRTAFVFPEPGLLEGIRSRGKRFLFLQDVTYSYPGGNAPAVCKACVECSLRSRVAIMGPNGAGKSTLASLVVGELAPESGNAWRHPNLRVAFVAQHSLHHLEQHMDLTATQYILWRFEGNEDREALGFRAEEEECSDPKTFRFVSDRLVQCDSHHPDVAHPEFVVDRRQRGRLGYEYEVRWKGRASTTWLSRQQLTAMGCLGMAKREDERQASYRSLSGRPLTTPAVEKHLAGFGLGSEESSHRRLGALSSGQRARVVLGAATWLAPHLLVLDEPTNYLDQPALAALIAGLQSFGGGVLIISHTRSFIDDVCSEHWIMQSGVLRREGVSISDEHDDVSSIDAAAAAAAAALKERKKQKRLKELRKRLGQEQSDDDEDDWYEDLLRKANTIRKSAS